MKQYILYFCIILAALLSCTGKTSDAAPPAEDTVAKQMLQGVWMSEDEVVTMRVAGDTISYSDSTMAPAYFAVVRDSLVIRGATEARYEILKQTEHIFEFRNHAGDIVKLLKSDNPDDAKAFTKHAAPPLNQNRLIKRDTVAIVADRKYHVYVQVNPSTYKVIRSTYNQEGIMVDNIYYDNIINVCVYDGGTRLFSRDSFLASLGPSVSWPIFQGGNVYANIKAEEARIRDEAKEIVFDTREETNTDAVLYAMGRNDANRAHNGEKHHANHTENDGKDERMRRFLVLFRHNDVLSFALI